MSIGAKAKNSLNLINLKRGSREGNITDIKSVHVSLIVYQGKPGSRAASKESLSR